MHLPVIPVQPAHSVFLLRSKCVDAASASRFSCWRLGAPGTIPVSYTCLLVLRVRMPLHRSMRRRSMVGLFWSILVWKYFLKEIYWLDLLSHKNVFRDYFVHKCFFLMLEINWFFLSSNILSLFFQYRFYLPNDHFSVFKGYWGLSYVNPVT